MGMNGRTATSISEIAAPATSSAPGAQSGRCRVTPDRICSTSCACASTPGVDGSSGVATISDSIRGARADEDDLAGEIREIRAVLSAFQAGIERRGSDFANQTRSSPSA